MTLVEAARRLGLSATTLRVQIRKGKLKAAKLGRDWTVTRIEVERYRTEHRRPTIVVQWTGPECDGDRCDDYQHREGCSLFA